MIPIGTVLGNKYRLLRLLGDGGMGSVYEAQHEKLGTLVALKVLHPELTRRPNIVERFLQEARVSAQIRSPHIVQVTDVDQTSDGVAYLVMELLQGEPLSRVLERDRKLPITAACDYTLQILEALEAAHALGVVHRDLKPENVFVTTLAGKRVLKLIDFGIAKVKRDDAAARGNLTMAGVTMGTAEYMAPEQAFSADKADVRSDLYAVGVMLYEMISGTRPVMGEDARVIAMKVERGEITPLVHIAPDVPQKIAGLCHRAMAPRPELRFQSATEMRLALEAAVQQGRSIVGSPAPAVTPAPAPAIDPALADVPAGPTTQRGAPLIYSPAPPAGATPVTNEPPPVMMAQLPPPAPMPTTPPVRRRSSNAGMWALLIGVPLLLGVGIVAAIAMSNRDDSHTVTPLPTVTSTATVTTDPTATSTSTGIDPLKPLNNTQPPLPNYTGTVVRPTVDGGGAIASDGGAPPPSDAGSQQANPFGLPSGLPSGFTLPPFDAGTISLPPMPSGFSIPGFGQPPPNNGN